MLGRVEQSLLGARLVRVIKVRADVAEQDHQDDNDRSDDCQLVLGEDTKKLA
jgi:hypothetical protein